MKTLKKSLPCDSYHHRYFSNYSIFITKDLPF